MTLGFTRRRDNRNTFFQEKILHPYNTDIQKAFPDMLPKIHTFRTGHRWRAGMKMHMVYGNRSKERFQFNAGIPELETCNGEQAAIIKLLPTGNISMAIDDPTHPERREMPEWTILLFAANDGFNSLEDMINWFFPKGQDSVDICLVGQIVHFTDFRY